MLGYPISVGWVFLVLLKSLGAVVLDDPTWGHVLVPCKQRIDIIGFIAYQLRECTSVAWMFNMLQPFRARAAFDAFAGAGRRVPILIIHGYSCNHAVWPPMQQHLTTAGHPTDATNLMLSLGNIDEYAQDITTAVAQPVRVRGHAPVLLCHGMGGLAMQTLLRQAGPSPATHVITLGMLHRGMAMARMGRGRNVHQMAWASPWLR